MRATVTNIGTLRAEIRLYRQQGWTVEEVYHMLRDQPEKATKYGHIQMLYCEFTRKEQEHEALSNTTRKTWQQ
jgi:hypothetical protein